jgi:thiosulfate/3-mercaptopyruvate sulfurtransferase
LLNNLKNDFLVSAEELAGSLESQDAVIIDTREPEDYIVSHIPGAVSMYDIFTYLCTKENGGYEVMQKHFARLFGDSGISGRERVFIYEDAMDNGYGRSCRGYFILSNLGYSNVSVLHGGYQAWLNKKMPVSKNIPEQERKSFPVNIDNSMMLSKEEVYASLNDPGIVILDCRDHAEWVGISSSPYGPDFAPRKGRIPGAIWIEWYNTMHHVDNIPWFKQPEEIKNLFYKSGIKEETRLYIYCFKGARTSNMFVALKLAGFNNVKNYFGSWNEWSRDFTMPIEQGYPKIKKSNF